MRFLSYDKWLSTHLKRKSYLLSEKNTLKFLKVFNPKSSIFIYTKTKRKKLIRNLKKKKFRYITTNFQFKKKFSNKNTFDSKIENCRHAIDKDKEKIALISEKTYKYSRFHLDKKIPRKYCDLIFRTWIFNFFKKKRSDYLIVYSLKNKILGFLLLKKEKKHSLRIDLIGVNKSKMREKVGKTLIDTALYLFQKNFKYLVVGFQSHNLIAKKFYTNLGFSFSGKKNIYHFYN